VISKRGSGTRVLVVGFASLALGAPGFAAVLVALRSKTGILTDLAARQRGSQALAVPVRKLAW